MKERKGAPKTPLVALGGEAEGDVDESMFAVDAAAEYGGAPAEQPHFDPMSAGLKPSPPRSREGLKSRPVAAATASEVDRELVGRIAQALLREFLHKQGLVELAAAFDEKVSRDEGTIQSRRQLRQYLTLGEPLTATTVVEQLVAQRLAEHGVPSVGKAARGSPSGELATPQVASSLGGSGEPPTPQVASSLSGSELTLGAPSGGSASGRCLGSFVMGSGVLKREGVIARPITLCDMSRNKIIDHVSDLDLESGVKLGVGSGGEVRSAVHKPTGTRVAVKYVQCEEYRYAEVTKELSILSQQNSPFVVGFHGSFFAQNRVLIVIELMAGSLHDASQLCGPMDEPDTICSVAWQIVRGVEYVHTECKSLLRDLKPQNLLFSMKGEVKLADFGMSTRVGTYGQASTFVGTFVYMSPERCQGCRYTYSSDVWSAGLCVLSLVTARPPYGAAATVFHVLEGPAPRVPADSRAGHQCADFVERCVQSKPEKRPSATELLQAPWFAGMNEITARQTLRQWLLKNDVGHLMQSHRRQPGRTGDGTFSSLDACLGGDVPDAAHDLEREKEPSADALATSPLQQTSSSGISSAVSSAPKPKRIDRFSDIDSSSGESLGTRCSSAVHKPTGEQIVLKLTEVAGDAEIFAREHNKRMDSLRGTCGYYADFLGCFKNDVGVSQTVIAMERMSGSLRDALKARGVLDSGAACSAAWQALSGLEYVHKNGLTMGVLDLPSLLYNSDGRVKLSCAGHSAGSVVAQSSSASSLPYMSPERVRGPECGPSADVWSAGLCVYTLATGMAPYSGRGSLVFAILEGEPPVVPSDAPAGAQCAQFVASCAKKVAAERATVEQLLQSQWFAGVGEGVAELLLHNWLVLKSPTAAADPPASPS